MRQPSRRTPWRWIPRILAPALAALTLAVGLALPARAHASLLGTDPADGAVLAAAGPVRVQLRFDEPVTLPDKAVQVFDAAGAAVPSDAGASDATVTVSLPEGLSGSYLVAWRVISADGHPVSGSLSFSVGAPSPHRIQPVVADASGWVAVPLAIVQVAAYLGLFLAVGLGVFAAFVLPDGGRADRLRGVLGRVGRYGAGVALAAAVASVGLTVADQQGLDPDGLLTLRAWTGATLDQSIGLALLVAGLVTAGIGAGLARRAVRRLLVGLGTAAAVTAPALTGHSRAYGPSWLVIGTDILHVLAGSIWFGGLIGLVIVLAATRRRPKLGVLALARFSTLAAGVLAVLLASGTVLAWRIVGSWADLFGTTYGLLLLAKIALVAVASGVAGWNRFVLLPRVRDAAIGEPSSGARSRRLSLSKPLTRRASTGQSSKDQRLLGEWSRLRVGRLVAVEASILVVVLAVTGVLVDQSPRPVNQAVRAGTPVVASAPIGSLTALATIAPGTVGRNALLIQFQDAGGDPVETAYPPTVRVRSDDVDLGAVSMWSQAAGTYQGVVVVPHPGRWRVQVSLRLSEFENPVAELVLDVS